MKLGSDDVWFSLNLGYLRSKSRSLVQILENCMSTIEVWSECGIRKVGHKHLCISHHYNQDVVCFINSKIYLGKLIRAYSPNFEGNWCCHSPNIIVCIIIMQKLYHFAIPLLLLKILTQNLDKLLSVKGGIYKTRAGNHQCIFRHWKLLVTILRQALARFLLNIIHSLLPAASPLTTHYILSEGQALPWYRYFLQN